MDETASTAVTERKVAFVTGSSRGIGRAIAEGLASRGYLLVLHGRDASIPGYVARTTVFSIPSRVGPVAAFRYFTDPQVFGEQKFDQMREAMTDVVAAFATPRRCDYLRAITADLIAQARELIAAWDPARGNFLGELTLAGKTSKHFESLHLALGEVVNRMGYTLENIRGDKLGRPLGTTSGGAAQPDKVESPFSGRSLEDIRDNVRGIERLYFGDAARGEGGLEGYLVQRGKSFAQLMRAQLDASFAALDAVPEPLTLAIVSGKGQVQAAIDQLGVLERAIQVDVINALSLSVGFNDNDGD